MLHRTFTYVHLSCSLRSWRDFARVLLFWPRSREGICSISLAVREFPRGARKKMAERSLPNPASYAGYSVPVTSLPVLNVQLIMLISFNKFLRIIRFSILSLLLLLLLMPRSLLWPSSSMTPSALFILIYTCMFTIRLPEVAMPLLPWLWSWLFTKTSRLEIFLFYSRFQWTT